VHVRGHAHARQARQRVCKRPAAGVNHDLRARAVRNLSLAPRPPRRPPRTCGNAVARTPADAPAGLQVSVSWRFS